MGFHTLSTESMTAALNLSCCWCWYKTLFSYKDQCLWPGHLEVGRGQRTVVTASGLVQQVNRVKSVRMSDHAEKRSKIHKHFYSPVTFVKRDDFVHVVLWSVIKLSLIKCSIESSWRHLKSRHHSKTIAETLRDWNRIMARTLKEWLQHIFIINERYETGRVYKSRYGSFNSAYIIHLWIIKLHTFTP